MLSLKAELLRKYTTLPALFATVIKERAKPLV
jgi:hypothetical protein